MISGKSISRGVVTNWLALGVSIAVSFFLSPFVVRHLGSAYYGIWALTMQFTGYLYLLDFGVRESVIRYTSKYAARQQGQRLNQVLATALLVYAPIVILSLLLTAVAMWAAPRWFGMQAEFWWEARMAILFVGLTIAQTFVFNVFAGVQIGLRRLEISNAINILLMLIRTGLVVWFVGQGYGIVALAAIQFGMAVAGGLVAWWMAAHLLREHGMPLALRLPRGRRLVTLSRRIFGYGWYVLVSNIGQKIIFTSDAIIVGMFLPLSSVTYYAIAGSLVDHLRTLLISTAQIFNPVSSHLFTLRKFDELGEVLLSGSRLTVVVALPVGITYAILGGRFVGLWMGDEFAAPSGQVLAVLAITQILSAPHNVVSSVLYGISRHKVIALTRFAEGLVNLSLSIVLVKSIGLLGVALGTAVSHLLVVLVWLPRAVCPIVGISLWRYFAGVYGRCLPAAAAIGVGAYAVEQYARPASLLSFAFWVGALVVLYLAVVYVMVLDDSERAWVGKFVGRRPAVAG